MPEVIMENMAEVKYSLETYAESQNVRKMATGNNLSGISMPDVFMENMVEVKYSM
jgi:hypothetical protein